MALSKEYVVDLCCGRGGFTLGFLREGFKVIGFDVRHWRDYPGELILQDVRTVDGSLLAGCTCIVASPPCTEFSQTNRWLRPRGFEPDRSIWEACVRVAAHARAQLVLENVHGAQRYFGAAANHYGKFYLWGDGVPALLPKGPRWKDRYKMRHSSPSLRAIVPLELSQAIAHHYRERR